ncbi:MAG: YqgE/AlgH family protein [Pseudomonadota bacterium]
MTQEPLFGPGRSIIYRQMDTDALSLEGKLLIAMPSMGDPRFEQSVILMCAHSENGAMGLIVNKPAPDLHLRDILKQLDLPRKGIRLKSPVYFGGPVETGRGFVLHGPDFSDPEGTLEVSGGFRMTATISALECLTSGAGPEKALLALGYAGWGPGQLEDEIQRNGWLTCDATDKIVFGDDAEAKWTQALGVLGVDPLLLSGEGGRA